MRRALFACCLVPIVATVASCLGPTAIELHVTSTSCSALTRVDIFVDHPEPSTSTQGCSDSASGEVGTLAILPSGALDAQVDISVVGFVGSPNCTPSSTGDKGCIIAKRTISFSPHQSLPLPVELDGQCAGFPCPDDQTCVVENGAPICKNRSCDSDGGGLKCIGDAGGGDAIGIGDVVMEAPPPACPPIALDAGTPTWSWSFDPRIDKAIHEDHDYLPSIDLVAPNGITTLGVTKCGAYLTATSQQNIVASNYKSLHDFTLAIAYRTLTDGEIIGLSGPNGGFNVKMINGLVTVDFIENFPKIVFTDTNKTNNGSWHTFEMTIASTDAGSNSATASFTIDGASVAGVSQAVYNPASGPLFVGPIEAVDQLAIYTP